MAKNVLLGVTGSVAATLTPKMVRRLTRANYEVQIVATNSALYFLRDLDVKVWTDNDEWPGEKYTKDQDIPHISLGDWADVWLIAPLSANTLAKIANGICDNLLTSLVRAWHRDKPIILVPAMNTRMWKHPITKEHLEKISHWYNLYIIKPVAKKLACGDIGIGAMANIDTIISKLTEISL